MTSKNIQDSFEKFDDLRCLIIGDVMVDSYIWGAVNRISPEAPVPVFEVEKRESRLGGAANVALNVQSLGATPVLCGVVGADSKGQIFNELLKGLNLPTEGIMQDSSRPTTSKTRIISSSHHMLRVDEEELSKISEEIGAKLLAFVKSEISKGIDVIIFEDYDKGVLSEQLIQSAITLANEKGIPTCVDPKKDNFNNYRGATLFKPNFKELTEGLKAELEKDDFESIVQLGKKFIGDQNIKQMLITLSEHGMILIDDSGANHVDALKRKILDVSGAGDTVISTAALALASGCDEQEIATLANLAGGIVCERVGVVPIEKEVLIREYNSL
jgi:rfaE bifunctional protein kinase chain/domain